MTKYRENALDPRDIVTMSIVGPDFKEALHLVTIAKVVVHDRITYSKWMQEWKKHYKEISETIRDIRSKMHELESPTSAHLARHHMRKLANTMINARQYVIDRRRAIREREDAAV